MTDIGELEKKAWFRFFKLCFVSVYVLSVCAVLFLSYDSLPSKYVDYWDIHCSDGRTAPTRENSIYPIDGQITLPKILKPGSFVRVLHGKTRKTTRTR